MMVFRMAPEVAIFILIISAVYVLWDRYAGEHDNWLTRLVEWLGDHSETILKISFAGTLIGAFVATIFLISSKT